MATKELPQYAIELGLAETWTGNWRANRKSFADLGVNGFKIHKLDFTSVIGEGATSIRTYMGIEFKTVTVKGVEKQETIPHLLVVGVDANGNDMTDKTKKQYVYDFSQPCPPTCGQASKLNGLI